MRNIDLQCELDFMDISSYGTGTSSSGVVRILKDLEEDITDRHVLIVEDIIDTGLTLSYLLRSLQARKPASLEICALLSKPSQEAGRPRRQIPRLRGARRVRRRIRARLRRSLPQPPGYLRPQARGLRGSTRKGSTSAPVGLAVQVV